MKTLCLLVFILSLSGCASFKNCGPLRGDPSALNQCMADKGHKYNQYEVGLEAFNAGDIKKAIKWLDKAAETTSKGHIVFLQRSYQPPTVKVGYFDAQKLLYEIYNEGLGVEADKVMAEKYYMMMGN